MRTQAQNNFIIIIQRMIDNYRLRRIGWCQGVQFLSPLELQVGQQEPQCLNISIRAGHTVFHKVASADIYGALRIAIIQLNGESQNIIDEQVATNHFYKVFEYTTDYVNMVEWNDAFERNINEVLSLLRKIQRKSYLVDILDVMES